MNRSIILRTFLGTLLMVALYAGVALAAQEQKPPNPQLPDPNSQAQQQRSETPSSSSPNAMPNSQPSSQLSSEDNGQGQLSSQSQQSFVGKILKSGDHFVLNDSTTHTTYQLDRQGIAKQYDGRDVRVTGRLDRSEETILVSTIEPLSR